MFRFYLIRTNYAFHNLNMKFHESPKNEGFNMK